MLGSKKLPKKYRINLIHLAILAQSPLTDSDCTKSVIRYSNRNEVLFPTFLRTEIQLLKTRSGPPTI